MKATCKNVNELCKYYSTVQNFVHHKHCGGSMHLDFYNPKLCTKQHKPKAAFSNADTLGNIITYGVNRHLI